MYVRMVVESSILPVPWQPNLFLGDVVFNLSARLDVPGDGGELRLDVILTYGKYLHNHIP
jgi:hypothetical protein